MRKSETEIKPHFSVTVTNAKKGEIGRGVIIFERLTLTPAAHTAVPFMHLSWRLPYWREKWPGLDVLVKGTAFDF